MSHRTNAAAIRIARSFTGKKKLVKYMGHYHGWSDHFMTDMEVPGSGRFISHGIPSEILYLSVLVPANDLDALESFRIEGLKHNIPALVAILGSGEFRAGDVHTGLAAEVVARAAPQPVN